MTRTFCDRCGNEYTKEYGWLHNKHYYTVARLCFGKEQWNDDDKDICPSCCNSYIHWFMHPEEDKKEI